jgi:hypothetical protein
MIIDVDFLNAVNDFHHFHAIFAILINALKDYAHDDFHLKDFCCVNANGVPHVL